MPDQDARHEARLLFVRDLKRIRERVAELAD
jgi:hypothetical protein